jgi:hypothetical protein
MAHRRVSEIAARARMVCIQGHREIAPLIVGDLLE